MKPYSQPKLYRTISGGKPDWYVYYKYRDPASGKMKAFKLRQGINYEKSDRKRAALAGEIIVQLNNLLRSGWSPFPFSERPETFLPVSDQLSSLLELKKEYLRTRSWQSYKYAIDSFSDYLKKRHFDFMTMKELGEVHVQGYFDDLSGRGLKGKTINGIRASLNVLFNMAMERDIIAKNPLRKIKAMKIEQGRNLSISERDLPVILDFLRQTDPQMYLFVRMIYFCFIRPIELLRLRVGNLDFASGIITIYGNQSKNKKQESVVIPAAFRAEMDYFRSFPPDHFLFGHNKVPSLVPYKRNRMTLMHSKYLRQLKMDGAYTLYSWKYTGSIAAYKAGIDLYSIMRQLRHHSLDQTQIYLRSLGMVPNTEFSDKMK